MQNNNFNFGQQNQQENNQKMNLNQQNYYMNQEQLSLIQSLQYAQQNYPQLINLNMTNLGYTMKVKNQVIPRFYVIKSFTEEDIHKGIKYNCWSSTKEGNKKLSNSYEESKKKNSDVLLFFSMNGSGRFAACGRVTSKVDENKIFEYWAMDDIWRGLMSVEFIFVKDIPNKILRNIKLSNNGYKPVTNSRDTQEIPRPEGEILLQIFEEFKNNTSILQHFQHYDERQKMFEISKSNK